MFKIDGKSYDSEKSGFTLSEVVIGVFLLGLVLVTITGVFVGGLSGAKKAQKKILAINLAEAMVDSIMLMKYTDVDLSSSPYDGTLSTPTAQTDDDGNGIIFPPSPYPQEKAGGGIARYKIEIKEYGTVAMIKEVTVTVSIEEAGGQGKTEVKLTSYKAQ
ncbi:MAG TPA: hypothetical protein PL110_08790 [Candidatus Eremiobacteraeota bacterium]|nr:MAG: hypothetical protein BWY64_02132 [bacterium ADurb.Bin363]HPZ08197.1 hypothetical protein [Candidatus Eremiobacteraeota bacterium]